MQPKEADASPSAKIISIKTFRQFFVYAFFLTLLTIATGAVVFLIVFRPTPQIAVPNIQGKHVVDALLALQEKNLHSRIELKFTGNPADKDRVMKSFPAAGSLVREKREVLLSVSRGARLAEIPDFVNRRFSVVVEEFEGLYSKVDILKIKTVDWVFSSEHTVDRIIAQEPLPNTTVDRLGTEISLLVSRGSLFSQELIPQFRGESFTSALEYLRLHRLEFEFYKVDEQFDIQDTGFFATEEGAVVEQFPPAGQAYNPSSILRLGIYVPARSPVDLDQALETDQASDSDQAVDPDQTSDSVLTFVPESYVDVIRIIIPEYIQNNPISIRVSRPVRETGESILEDYFDYKGRKTQIDLPFTVESGVILEALYNNQVFWKQTIE